MKRTICVFVTGFALVFFLVSEIKSHYSVEEPIEEEKSCEELKQDIANSSNNIISIVNIVMNS